MPFLPPPHGSPPPRGGRADADTAELSTQHSAGLKRAFPPKPATSAQNSLERPGWGQQGHRAWRRCPYRASTVTHDHTPALHQPWPSGEVAQVPGAWPWKGAQIPSVPQRLGTASITVRNPTRERLLPWCHGQGCQATECMDKPPSPRSQPRAYRRVLQSGRCGRREGERPRCTGIWSRVRSGTPQHSCDREVRLPAPELELVPSFPLYTQSPSSARPTSRGIYCN